MSQVLEDQQLYEDNKENIRIRVYLKERAIKKKHNTQLTNCIYEKLKLRLCKKRHHRQKLQNKIKTDKDINTENKLGNLNSRLSVSHCF